MPKHKLVSAKEVLSRLIRSLGYKLPSVYIDDCLEWIPEALGMLQVTNSLVLETTGDIDCVGELVVSNYCVDLPCGFVAIENLEDEFCNQICEGTGENRDRSNTGNYRVNSFEVDPYTHQTSDGLPVDEPGNIPPYYLDGSDLALISGSSRPGYYTIRGNKLQTSFESGYIRMSYWALPVCKEGYPLIPDNENYKQAIEWYIIRRLIGSGYEHKVFSYQYADEQFEKYANRGMNEVSYYSPDGAAKLNRTVVRLMPPRHFHSDYFIL